MRKLITLTLALTALALQSAMAAQVTATASVTILEPVKVSMQQIEAEKAAINTSRDYHYAVSFKAEDNCSYINAAHHAISQSCATATVNFN